MFVDVDFKYYPRNIIVIKGGRKGGRNREREIVSTLDKYVFRNIYVFALKML